MSERTLTFRHRNSGGDLWRLSVIARDAALAERVSAAFETLCSAVSAFESTPGGSWKIEGLTLDLPSAVRLDTALALAFAGQGKPPEPLIEKLKPRDWLRENQESFPPRRIGGYFVYGSHFRGHLPPGAIGLLIDAATAFGTGEHATTAGCLLALDLLARRRRFSHVLDMGTGTGILAIAAAKKWGRAGRCPVIAADIDAGSVEVARINARLNGVGNRVVLRWSDGYRDRLIRRCRPYDLVFANILARPLAAMARDLAQALAPGGVAVLSGLIEEQEAYVLSAHRLQHLTLRHRLAIDGWHTLILSRAGVS